MSLPTRIQEIVQSVIKRRGYFTTEDIERAEQLSDWREPLPYINARPERIKLCPICLKPQPISEFLIESDKLRTVIRFSRTPEEEVAWPCAEVEEFCRSCET